MSETVTTVTSTIARRGGQATQHQLVVHSVALTLTALCLRFAGMGEGADEGAVAREALQELSRATDARLAQLEARQGAAEKYLTQIGSAQVQYQ